MRFSEGAPATLGISEGSSVEEVQVTLRIMGSPLPPSFARLSDVEGKDPWGQSPSMWG